MPQDYSDFDKAQALFNRIGGLSDLIFSKYFVNYLGFDDQESYYFFEIIKGFNMRKVLSESGSIENAGLLAMPNLF